MKTELLIIKDGKEYIRVKDDIFLKCGLDKASVYPMSKLGSVKALVKTLHDKGMTSACIKKLNLIEEDLT
ncbi:MAG: hypothetical protein GY707_12565 [Desulfobacteraceae bacterium]|nr:hypothetical protein [Desulfobacteraceae bacterium]